VKVPVEAWALEELKRWQLARTLKQKLLAIVERESGVHTSDTLVRRLQEQGINVSFSDVDEVTYEFRGASLQMGKNRKLEFVPPWREDDDNDDDD
jgi:hypothetical protein